MILWNKYLSQIVLFQYQPNSIKIKGMKKNDKKIQFLSLMIIMAFLVLPLTVNGQGSKANFAGTWALNAAKSNFGTPPAGGGGGGQGGGQRGGGNFVVTQDANVLTRTTTGQDGTQRDHQIYS